jgi:hypothetical protein
MDPITIGVAALALFGVYEYSKHAKEAAASGTVVRPLTPLKPSAPKLTAPIAIINPAGLGVIPTPPTVYPGFLGQATLRPLPTGTKVYGVWSRSATGALPPTGNDAADAFIYAEQAQLQGTVQAGSDPGNVVVRIDFLTNQNGLPIPFSIGSSVTTPSTVWLSEG